jgi:2-polyprenyl-6-methoxyphenol hydroxylase-like FAD-dependent oxidoreductase
MLPFYAQGAGHAIEDAAALAVCLGAEPREPGSILRSAARTAPPRFRGHARQVRSIWRIRAG